MKTTLYQTDTARYVCVLAETEGEPWRLLIRQLTKRFSEPISCNGIPIDADVRFGLFPFRVGDLDGPDVVRAAITAVLDARQKDQRWASYNSAKDDARRRSFGLLTDFRQALTQLHQLTLVYQPRLDIRSGRCSSVEALLRWQHPVLGYVPPGEFIPLVEQTALARPMTAWVVGAALTQISSWRSQGLDLRVSLNVSARNLEERNFADRLASALTAHQIDPSSIELEFTESALMRDEAGILEQLHAIKDMGVEIAIDDFGSGYSNHSYLQKIPAKTVKLDQSLIMSLTTSPRDRTIVQNMIEMLHRLDYRVVAEGVETREVYELLSEWTCDEVQGYHIARPLEPETLSLWLREAGHISSTLAIGRGVVAALK